MVSENGVWSTTNNTQRKATSKLNMHPRDYAPTSARKKELDRRGWEGKGP